jgi:hypothetical protein
LPPPLSVETPGGRQKLNCANIEGLFRIIQSIPSPKTEPFKRWLAKTGYERVFWKDYYAHSTDSTDKSDWQPLSEHLAGVAKLV